MPCAALNAANRPCGISTPNKYCHIHAPKLKVNAQTKELGRLNNVERDMKVEVMRLRDEVSEVEKLRLQVERLLNEKKELISTQSVLNNKIKSSRILAKSNQRLKSRIIELETQNLKLKDENDELVAMKEDYDEYQTIRQFEIMHNRLANAYGVTTSIEVNLALKKNPSIAVKLIGFSPRKRYNELRIARNIAAHRIA